MKNIILFLTIVSFNALSDVGSSDVLTLSRTACFGNCPTYQVYIFSDGTIVFNGEANVAKIGISKLKASSDLFVELVQILDESNFTTFQNEYGWGKKDNCKKLWTDNPSVYIDFQYAGTTKSVKHYLGCRGFPREQDLLNLEKSIEEAVNINEFVGKPK